MANGGKRPGAGRKKGSKLKKTIEQEEALNYLREKIRGNFDELIEAMLQLAKDRSAKPSGQTIAWLIEMVTGKPKNDVNVQFEGMEQVAELLRKLGTPKIDDRLPK